MIINIAKPEFLKEPGVQLLNKARTYVSGASKAPSVLSESPVNDSDLYMLAVGSFQLCKSLKNSQKTNMRNKLLSEKCLPAEQHK